MGFTQFQRASWKQRHIQNYKTTRSKGNSYQKICLFDLLVSRTSGGVVSCRTNGVSICLLYVHVRMQTYSLNSFYTLFVSILLIRSTYYEYTFNQNKFDYQFSKSSVYIHTKAIENTKFNFTPKNPSTSPRTRSERTYKENFASTKIFALR